MDNGQCCGQLFKTRPTTFPVDVQSTLIAEMYKEKLAELKKVVESIHSIALATDFWTSNNNESYCSVMGDWIGSDWKVKSVALGCLLVDEQHTVENVASFFWQNVDTWLGISSTVRPTHLNWREAIPVSISR